MNPLTSNNNTIIHSGTVSRVSGESVFVSLDKNVHCEGCRIKSACGISDSSDKEVEMISPNESFHINESVQVLIKKDLGLKAVVWAYVLPFIIMIAVLTIASQFVAEWFAGLLALSVLVPYYSVLYYMNSFFRKKFRISVLKLA
jgi:sigma-E factor negative regulatory protein RseC